MPKFQIMRYWPLPEAFHFVRDEHGVIRQFNSFEEAIAVVKGFLYEPNGVQHLVVTAHRVFSIKITPSPPPEPIREIIDYDITGYVEPAG